MRPTAAWMSNIHSIKKYHWGFTPFLSPAPVGSDNSGHGKSKSLKILQIPAAPLPRYVSCRVVLPLMCEMTEGVRRTHVWVKTASLPQIDGFWQTEMRNCSLVDRSPPSRFQCLHCPTSLPPPTFPHQLQTSRSWSTPLRAIWASAKY